MIMGVRAKYGIKHFSSAVAIIQGGNRALSSSMPQPLIFVLYKTLMLMISSGRRESVDVAV